MLYELDFYKEFKLETPVCGIINKVSGPKGIKRKESDYYTSYHLHVDNDVLYVYNKEPVRITPGLYWVMDVCKLNNRMTWIHYLFVVDEDGSTYPVYEFIGADDTTWVKSALPVVKDYFSGGELDPIGLTVFKHKVLKNRWSSVCR